MSDLENCRVCGQKRPADAPSGLCPACLLKAGLVADSSERDGSEKGELTILFGPASSGVLAAFGEEFGKIPPVLLRDADSESEPGPVIRASSEEIPNPAARSARLQLFGEIARGGMGAVLKGRDADLGRDLAVKILLESHRHKPEMVRRFIEEAQIAGQLQHPGIVPVYELGAFGDRRPYFAMKLVKGHTLAEILASRKSLGEGLPRLLSIFESICQTMAYAHARGVIHRDLKPSNVMVGSFGEVQVMDWGLAKVLPRGGTVEDASAGHTKDQGTIIATARSASESDLSQAGSIMGTPAYMAPEQARGEIGEVDERADVFALGSIFCELLTGQPAFTGRNSGEIQRKAARGELAEAVTRLDQNDLGHDPELIALAKSCLAPEHDDRPRHAGEIAEKMSLYHSRVQERLRQSEIERAAEKARAEEATKRAAVERQRLRLTVALAASVLGFIVLGGGGWAYVAKQKAARQFATERVVTEALDKATLLRGQAKAAPIDDTSKWTDALAAAHEARSSMETGEPTVALRERVTELLATLQKERSDATRRADELAKDKRLFERLDAIRLQSVDQQELEKTNEEYALAFRDFGIDVDQLEPEAAARRFTQRENPQEFAARLDDWTLIRKAVWELYGEPMEGEKAKDSWNRLILTAQATDDDPWRNSLRSLIGDKNHEAIDRLASDAAGMSKQSARSLHLLAMILESSRRHEPYCLDKSVEILKTAWRLNPSDYQICRALGTRSANERDRVAFSTAAVTARPESPQARLGRAEALLPRDALLMTPYDRGWVLITREGREISNTAHPFELPRFKVKCRSGDTLLCGPERPCDPQTIRSEDLSVAISDLRSAIRLAPGSVEAHRSLASALVLQEQYDDSISESRLIAQLGPSYGFALNLAGALYLKGQVDHAINLVQQEIKKCPDDPEAYQLLGLMYREQGKQELAFSAFAEMIRRVNYPFTNHDRFRVALLEEVGTPDEVISVYREVIRSRPNGVRYYEHLASFLESNGRIDEAIAVFREAITLNSDWFEREVSFMELGPPNLRRLLAELYERAGRSEEADAEFDKVIDLLLGKKKNGDHPDLELGMTYLWRGRRELARIELRRIIEISNSPNYSRNHFAWELATNHNPKQRDGTLAVEFATKACEMTDWKLPMYLDTLAAACAESGDFEAAVNWQTKAIELLMDEKEKKDFGRRLKLYQEKEPFHVASPSR